ncbi:hypothetical protein PHISCL_03165 [Aspergillus sclerotialis]|uniref:Protein kinase domain-containing protein n=1 Tax=Aspergillus sclerotialis TaxID=2070753 RepID=A0A3A2ZQA2_9EURO|nr:hypothetical protein PHISCL_03165 [Aspergillus sclerotialis]
MEAYSQCQWIGPFEVLKWPEQPGTYGYSRHHVTFEQASIKIQWFGSLAHEAHTLQAAAGGIGMPMLHWFEAIDGKEVMILDTFGPSLEELFRESGHYFSMQTLLLFAEQMLARVEFIHSRNIIHGSLDPWSFALGSSSWQSQQVLLVDFDTTAGRGSLRDDLYAIGEILAYFYGRWNSWEEYRQSIGHNIPKDTAPVINRFLHTVAGCRTIDYSSLRLIFRETFMDLATSLATGLGLRGPRAIREGFDPNLNAMSTIESGTLFHILGSKLALAGKQIAFLGDGALRQQYPQLLRRLDEILAIYIVLLSRDRLSFENERQAMRAYHIPNRLWRDLRWFLSSTHCAPVEVQLALVGKVYNFVGVLYEAIPSYRVFWTDQLLALADTRKRTEPICGKSAWTQTVSYWRNQSNMLKATGGLLK